MENETPIQICRNCQYPLPESANFCPNCSQRNHDGRFTFKEFLSQLFDNLLNLDNRIFRTLGALAIPGKLTVNYFEGKHIRYYHPMRLFLISGAFLIAMLSVKIGKNSSQVMPESFKQAQQLHQKHLFYLQLDSLKRATAATLQNRNSVAALDTLLAKLDSSYISGKHDSLPLRTSFFRNSEKETIIQKGSLIISLDESNKKNFAVEDIEYMSEDSILEAYHIQGFWTRILVRQQIKLHKKGDNFIFYLLGNTIWMMLVMMPMLALVLKMLYFRKNYFYLENLIFSFHVHSFLFLLISIVLLAVDWLGKYSEPVGLTTFFVSAFYPMFAMKRFYKQGWIKTMFKFFISSISYLVIFILAILCLVLASLVFF